MDRYFYHGFSSYVDESAFDKFFSIVNSGGLKNQWEDNEWGRRYHPICMYRRNDDFLYRSSELSYLRSARCGFIDSCFGFIISSHIDAYKVPVRNDVTDLVDEWRSDGNIPLNQILGIFVPFQMILKSRSMISNSVSFDKKFQQMLVYARMHDWMIVDSDEENFYDKLDVKVKKR